MLLGRSLDWASEGVKKRLLQLSRGPCRLQYNGDVGKAPGNIVPESLEEAGQDLDKCSQDALDKAGCRPASTPRRSRQLDIRLQKQHLKLGEHRKSSEASRGHWLSGWLRGTALRGPLLRSPLMYRPLGHNYNYCTSSSLLGLGSE